MTEKRFYYNTFYHPDDMSRVFEYEIIDRQSYPNYPNHNEEEDVPKWYIYVSENDSRWQDMLVNLLNKLHEENEQLKQRNENQYQQLNQLWKLIEAKDWDTLTNMVEQMKKDEEQLQRESGTYGDVE